MGKPRLFSTAAITAMQDPELTGLDWRVYLWVSLHDGMSLVKGKGAGCYASNLTLFAEAQCDYAAGCRSLSKLVERGHLVREKKGRTTAYRVTFGAPDMLQAGNLSPREHVAASQGETPEHVAEHSRQTADNAVEPTQDYSSLSEELDSVETEELNSFEKAHLCDARSFSGDGYDPFRPEQPAETLNPPEGVLGRRLPLASRLPRNWPALPIGAQVARLDRAYTEIGRDPDKLDDVERTDFTEWLASVFDEFGGGEMDAVAQQALRLSEEMHSW